MCPSRALVAFSTRHGSTAAAAEVIADVLRTAGLAVDCQPKDDVEDVTCYHAVILGSGMFVPGRASDGGGFLERHAAALRGCNVWLFSTGPIGGRAGRGMPTASGDECAVVTVGRAIGARGVATFGSVGTPPDEDPVASSLSADAREIRTWAGDIATALGAALPATGASGAGNHGANAAR